MHMSPDDKKCKWLMGWEKEQENLKRLASEQKLRDEAAGITKDKNLV